MQTNNFSNFSLCEPILRAVAEEGYTTPTDIQQAAIPLALLGKDLLATAQTGTGKTAAFALPMLHRLSQTRPSGKPGLRALILTPTRELAQQIETNLAAYGRHLRLSTAVVVGGVPMQPQIRALRKGVDILVATPGRLLDLFRQRQVRFDQVEIFVLDEADRMLDMGFLPDIKKVVAEIPKNRQTLFFSATLCPQIATLAGNLLQDPSRVEMTPVSSISDKIDQRVLFVQQEKKKDLLNSVLKGKDVHRALVFTRTKHRADRIVRHLSSSGISAEAIHSNKSQNARQRSLMAFDRGRIKVLVATDIVARGIDVEGISHVINYELPNDPESYVHRIGRTARAGKEGIALSFCDAEEVAILRGIEKLTKATLVTVDDHPYHAPEVAASRNRNPVAVAKASPGGRRKGGRANGRPGGARSDSRPRARSGKSAARIG